MESQAVFAVRRLATNTMGFTPKLCADIAAKFGERVPVARIYGRATGFTPKRSRIDPEKMNIQFDGSFQGQELITGKVYRSKVAYFPKDAEQILVDHYLACRPQTENGEESGTLADVTFAFDLTLQPFDNSSNPTMSPYQWGVAIHTKIKELDFLAELMEKTPPPVFLLGEPVESLESLELAFESPEPEPETKPKKKK